MARPSQLDEGMIEELCRYLREGTTIKTAATLAGVSERAYHLWQSRGREEIERVAGSSRRSVRKSERVYVDFVRRTTRARRRAIRRRVESVREAGEEDWRAAAWMLERMDSESWTKKQRHEVSAHVEVDTLQTVVMEALKGRPEAKTEVARALYESDAGEKE